MNKLVPHLWYDKEAREAAEFYVSIFGDSAITGGAILEDTPSGTAETVTVSLAGQDFMLLSAGPYFKFNPSISLRVDCSTAEEVESLWKKLSDGGSILMELDSYPFSPRYGWCQDRYGLSWQIMQVEGKISQKITPTLMFVGEQYGRAEEAIKLYCEVFRESKAGDISRYGEGQEFDTPGTVMYASFTLEGMKFAAMDSGYAHEFQFNEAISFIVNCDTQEEIDYYWDRLSFVPESEQCGWLKDKFGVSWQIVPASMDEMMKTGDREKIRRVTEAFLKMKKFDIALLEKAYEG
ncbi:VOC family protein [Youngiibacter multivorans]|uniref:3-demethylubiquinone-9 3-methyltransferase (Glyoxalase superfamily) n=1 Tax=Youngiibacter multivorans TaxID=937251 RepID=A0ABS4G420_9CLOT|nr:putative 3-demethylubiquinone-9 3-methyltransferase (glyoxalase superfamily) [Youngiibacter multivorans]